MNDSEQDAPSSGLGLSDIYFVLFRQKWIILAFCALGLLGGIAVCVIKPPRFRSEAKLYIRYVENPSLNLPGSEPSARTLNDQQAGILDTEVQILKSLDVARQVADAVGPERILARLGGGSNRAAAAAQVLKSLDVQPPMIGSVISVTFEHPDAEVDEEVLRQVITAYINKHKEMHQTVGIFGEVLPQETQRLRDQLAETEQKLKEVKIKAGVTSLEESKKNNATDQNRIRGDIWNAQADLATDLAQLSAMTNQAPLVASSTNAEVQIPSETVEKYKEVCNFLGVLSRMLQDDLTRFKDGSIPITALREQIEDSEIRKKQLEAEYPLLVNLGVSAMTGTGQPANSLDPTKEIVQVRGLRARIGVLTNQLAQIQFEAARMDEQEDAIQNLQRKRDGLEADLKVLTAAVAETRINLGEGKAPNIGIVQYPSPAAKSWSKPFKKKLLMLTGGCVAAGFVLAFLIEFFLDRSVKRPIEVTSKLQLPLFISIPDLNHNGNRALAKPSGKEPLLLNNAPGGDGEKEPPADSRLMQIVASERNHPLRRYFEGLRDRLIVYFEVRNLTQKPKLVAVTSCGKGAGVTSIAAGLAASLSETGDGNVLLVDMNAEQGASQQFYKGKPGCGLDDALASETKNSALVQSPLYVATERSGADDLPRALPTRFANLMPKLKASDYDYIIFDMPPVSQTSMTPRLSRLMDMVLLVIESEKTSQDVVKQATALLAESKANVSAVLNKTRNYVPTRLHQDFLNDT